MDEETYKALKQIIEHYLDRKVLPQTIQNVQKVKDWIDEVAKEYEVEEVIKSTDTLEEKIEKTEEF